MPHRHGVSMSLLYIFVLVLVNEILGDYRAVIAASHDLLEGSNTKIITMKDVHNLINNGCSGTILHLFQRYSQRYG